MGFLDDIVKLKYGEPLAEGIDTLAQNITTMKSNQAMQDFLKSVQFNEDGTARPGGATQLDINDPDSIAKVMNRQSDAMSNLLGVSGGKITPEIGAVQNLSDRILKGMGEASSLRGTQSEIKYREAMADYYKDKSAFQNAELPTTLRNIVMESGAKDKNGNYLSPEEGTIAGMKLEIVDALKNHPFEPLAAVREAIDKKYPGLSVDDKQQKYDDVASAMTSLYKTSKDKQLAQQQAIAKQQLTEKVIDRRSKLLQEAADAWDKLDPIIGKKPYVDAAKGNEALAQQEYIAGRVKRAALADPDLAPWANSIMDSRGTLKFLQGGKAGSEQPPTPAPTPTPAPAQPPTPVVETGPITRPTEVPGVSLSDRISMYRQMQKPNKKPSQTVVIQMDDGTTREMTQEAAKALPPALKKKYGIQ